MSLQHQQLPSQTSPLLDTNGYSEWQNRTNVSDPTTLRNTIEPGTVAASQVTTVDDIDNLTAMLAETTLSNVSYYGPSAAATIATDYDDEDIWGPQIRSTSTMEDLPLPTEMQILPDVATRQQLSELYYKSPAQRSAFISQAITMALDMGLHSRMDETVNRFVRAYRARVFWCCFIFDSTSSAIGGKPTLINDEEVHADMIEPGDLGPETENYSDQYMLHCVRGWQICRKIRRNSKLVSNRPPPSKSVLLENLDRLDKDLVEWQEQMPKVFDPIPTSGSITSDVKALAAGAQLLCFALIILLHHPYLPNPKSPEAFLPPLKGGPPNSQGYCTQAAKEITNISGILLKDAPRTFEQNTPSRYALNFAIRIHLRNSKCTVNPTLAKESRRDLQKSMDYVERVENLQFFRINRSKKSDVADLLASCRATLAQQKSSLDLAKEAAAIKHRQLLQAKLLAKEQIRKQQQLQHPYQAHQQLKQPHASPSMLMFSNQTPLNSIAMQQDHHAPQHTQHLQFLPQLQQQHMQQLAHAQQLKMHMMQQQQQQQQHLQILRQQHHQEQILRSQKMQDHMRQTHQQEGLSTIPLHSHYEHQHIDRPALNPSYQNATLFQGQPSFAHPSLAIQSNQQQQQWQQQGHQQVRSLPQLQRPPQSQSTGSHDHDVPWITGQHLNTSMSYGANDVDQQSTFFDGIGEEMIDIQSIVFDPRHQELFSNAASNSVTSVGAAHKSSGGLSGSVDSYVPTLAEDIFLTSIPRSQTAGESSRTSNAAMSAVLANGQLTPVSLSDGSSPSPMTSNSGEPSSSVSPRMHLIEINRQSHQELSSQDVSVLYPAFPSGTSDNYTRNSNDIAQQGFTAGPSSATSPPSAVSSPESSTLMSEEAVLESFRGQMIHDTYFMHVNLPAEHPRNDPTSFVYLPSELEYGDTTALSPAGGESTSSSE
ncbi:lactose regulatory protein lac9 and GAL4-like protein, partial [Gryganskiella cystojenkinii]